MTIKRPPTKPATPSPLKFPDGFVLIQDTREQTPLFTRLPPGLTIKSQSLKNGDYSIHGFTHAFAIERKMISDLHSYIGKERTDKTTPKMERFREMTDDYGWVGLAIEGTEDDCYHANQYSSLTINQIRGALTSFRVRYGVQIYFHPDRKFVSRWILESAVKFYNMKREVR